MRLVGVFIDDTAVGRTMVATVPLEPVTLLFGMNGAGKSRLLEVAASLLNRDRSNYVGRRNRLKADGSEDWVYGGLYLQLEWYRGDDLTPDWPWLRSHLVDDGSLDRETVPLAGLGLEEDDDVVRFTGRAMRRLTEELPTEARVAAMDFLGDVLDNPVVSFNNWEGGFVELAADRRRMRDHADQLRLLHSTVAPDSFWADVAARCLAPSGPFESIVTITQMSDRIDEYLDWMPEFPDVVRIGEAEPAIEQHVDQFITASLPSAGGVEPWLVEEAGGVRIDPVIRSRLDQLAATATDLLPRFIGGTGSINIQLRSPREWKPGEPRTLVTLGSYDYRMIGAGSRRWVTVAIIEACRRLQARPEPRPDRPLVDPPVVMLIDEPELHLHPLAQRDVADWMIDRSRDGAIVVAATHAAEMLDDPTNSATVLEIRRVDGVAVLREISDDVLSALDQGAAELGLSRSTWLQVTNGILVVEGQHDLDIIRHFFGRTLGLARVRAFALRGHDQLRAIMESEFYGSLGLPLRVMLDDVRAQVLQGGAMPKDQLTSEERTVLEQLVIGRDKGLDIEAVPFALPDIIAALPEAAVRRAFPTATFDSWPTLVRLWRDRTPTKEKVGFKTWALRTMNLPNVGANDFVREVLHHTWSDDLVAGELHRAVAEALASISAANRPLL